MANFYVYKHVLTIGIALEGFLGMEIFGEILAPAINIGRQREGKQLDPPFPPFLPLPP